MNFGIVAHAQANRDSPSLRVHMIGTGEYDAAESLAKFKKHLEANYRVEVTTSLGKDKSRADIDTLKSADVLGPAFGSVVSDNHARPRCLSPAARPRASLAAGSQAPYFRSASFIDFDDMPDIENAIHNA